jgi:predicted nucleic acid-binding protein
VIADTTFLIDLLREQKIGKEGRATRFLESNREIVLSTTIITVGEIAAGFDEVEDARDFFARIPLLRLSMETVYECARVDQELRSMGQRLGENDNWIAGIARYYGEPLISNDKAFRRVRGLEVVSY